jgi:hypothetical protein
MGAGELVAICGGPVCDLAGAFHGGVLQVVDVHGMGVAAGGKNSKFENQ